MNLSVKLDGTTLKTVLKSIFIAGGIGLFISLNINVFAQSSSTIDVTTNTGGNTVCVNGECTTSDGNSKSRVCVNGECFESDGDLHVTSENGETSVKIDSNKESSAVVEQSSENSIESTVRDDGEAKGESKSNAVVEDTEKEFSIVSYIKNQLSILRDIITFQFLFGDN